MPTWNSHIGCGVLLESSWWVHFHGRAKTYADWVWDLSKIGELCVETTKLRLKAHWWCNPKHVNLNSRQSWPGTRRRPTPTQRGCGSIRVKQQESCLPRSHFIQVSSLIKFLKPSSIQMKLGTGYLSQIFWEFSARRVTERWSLTCLVLSNHFFIRIHIQS